MKRELKFRTGWIPDIPDQRDIKYSAIYRIPKKLPPRVDLKAFCSTIENQGNLGSCTANALVGAVEFLEKKNGKPLTDLSRLFVYYGERLIEHTVSTDSGASLRSGIKSLYHNGVCPESEWPYVESQFTRKPSSLCYKHAKKRKITSYQRLNTVDEMKSCLAEGFPFSFGFAVYLSFRTPKVFKTGVIPMPKKDEAATNEGHAVLCVGYDDSKKVFRIRNSWGKDWGINGYGTMPYKYLEDRNLSDDFWTIRTGLHM